jgi:Holliday junction DNA helicase RuvB
MVADRPVGIESICAGLAEDRATIEDSVEPFLMQQLGFVTRTARGRVITEAGLRHWRDEDLEAP